MKQGLGYQLTRPARAFGRYSLDALDWKNVGPALRFENVRAQIRILRRAVNEMPDMPQTPEGGRPYYTRTQQSILRNTAWAARVYWMATGIMLGGWLIVVAFWPMIVGWFSGVMLVLSCWLLMSRAALNACIHWQVSTGRNGSMMDFFRSEGSLWPPLPARPE